MAELQNIHFAWYRITTDEFALTDEKSDTAVNAEMRINLGFNSIQQDRVITIQTKCLFYQGDKLLMVIAVTCFFIIAPEDWEHIYNAETTTLTIPLLPARHLASLCVSTTRGILHSKTEQMPEYNFIIPPVDLNEIIKEKVIVAGNK